jgi:dipeptidyl aminopeptidase/acylaminoacyl peptidase
MTYDAVPLIPRSVLFGNPTYASPAISPDGTRLGYIAPDEGVLNVWVGPLEAPQEAKALTHDRGRGIRVFGFCHDDKHLFYLQDEGGNENWQLHLLDLESGEERSVTPFADVQVQVLGHNRWTPDRMLLGLNKDRPELHDLYTLDIASGELTKVRENPGYAGWIADTDLNVRGAVSLTPEGGLVYYLNDPSSDDPDELKPWLEVPPSDTLTTGLEEFSRDGKTLYLQSSIDANAAQLYAVDLATGEHTLLAGDDTYDVGSVEVDPATRTPQAVIFNKDRREWVFLDEDYARDVARVRGLLAVQRIDGELGISRSERSGDHWLVSVQRSDGAVRYYIHNREQASLTFLFSHKPDLDDYDLAEMEPFEFIARDGVEVHGYVTFPRGVERTNLPAVLDVHGGPWARDVWGYNPEVQWLANRGYVAIQVNFRGSTGYGKAFGNLGDKQWGRTMHTDLLDAVDHFVAQGVIDRDRIGIMGGSYGGYAALAGAAFTPDAFRCAVDLCGPSNLLTLLETIPEYWKPQIALMYAKVGNPETENDMLWEWSPLSKVGDIRIPVLVAQGANDPRVKQDEAEQIVNALKGKGLPHEYLLFEDEGHGLARPENREIYYSATERFLATHLGGRSES